MADHSNVRNVGIAHLSNRAGGEPACKNRHGFVSLTSEDFAKAMSDGAFWQPCKRCAAIFTKRQAKKVA